MFYTILPKWPKINCRFERIARFAPYIGIFIGIVQSITWLVLSTFNWSNTSISLIILALGIWITGGLHIDGLMDTADGLAAGKDRCLEAMKDSRIGAYGVQSFGLIICLQLAALLELNELSPLAFPIVCFWGRFAPLWAIGNFKYLNEDKKKNKSFHQIFWKGSQKEFSPSLLIIFFIILSLMFIPQLSVNHLSIISGILIGSIPSFLIPNLIGQKLGGHNGDTYGATVVLVETFTIILLALIW